MSDLKKIGTLGVKTLIYFEVVSTLALIIGIVVAVVFHPGAGLNIDAATLDPKAAAVFVGRAKETGFIPFLLGFIPRTFIGALADGEVPQVLLISILTGFAIANLGEAGKRALSAIEVANKVVFGIVRIVVRAAPLGALGEWRHGGELWSGFTDESAEADGDVLSVEFFVCGGRARNHRAAGGIFDFPVSGVYQG